MSSSLQTYLAQGIVLFVLLVFVWRWWTRRKKSGCGGGCGCASTKPKIRRKINRGTD